MVASLVQEVGVVSFRSRLQPALPPAAAALTNCVPCCLAQRPPLPRPRNRTLACSPAGRMNTQRSCPSLVEEPMSVACSLALAHVCGAGQRGRPAGRDE